ncbi:transposase [Sulfitobacter marinus]|uniref:transposase n=1 Tax=Sulfitobacter marinus TaxID=394264 RepID=UPI000A3D8A83|nr:transposase [Sulfitobacter marinus]
MAQVVECGYAVSEVAERLGISTKSLYKWKAQLTKSPRVRSEVAEQAAEIRPLEARVGPGIGLKEILALELGPHGVTVNAILPGSVTGPRMDAALAAKAEATGVSLETAQAAEV